MATTQIGAMRTYARLEKRVAGQDDFGEENGAWDLVANLWLALEPLEGAELVSARQISAEVTHRIRTRWTKEISPTYRLKFVEKVFGETRTRLFDVLVVRDLDSRHVELELLAKEVNV